jgi:hypothetical protein
VLVPVRVCRGDGIDAEARDYAQRLPMRVRRALVAARGEFEMSSAAVDGEEDTVIDEPVGGLVEQLGDFEDLLRPSYCT